MELQDFYRNFSYKKGIIGYSWFNRPIYFMRVYKSPFPVVIAQYAIHAREYITTYLALEQIKRFINCGGRGTVYFIPAVNPDGIKIVLDGNELYKANGRGVDLNVNFDARWGRGEFNRFSSGAANYVGQFPFSERESLALKVFTLAVKPDATLSYHSKGEEIYWEFSQKGERRARDFAIAKALSKSTGYPLKGTPNSCGGYKDWCIEKLNIPALTIEVGSDRFFHPIGKEGLRGILDKNIKDISVITDIL